MRPQEQHGSVLVFVVFVFFAFSETQGAADVADGVEPDVLKPCVLKPPLYLLRSAGVRGPAKGAREDVASSVFVIAELGEIAEALQGLGGEEVAERRRQRRRSG